MPVPKIKTKDDALTIFRDVLNLLWKDYDKFPFFAERDIVWTVHRRLVEEIGRQALDLTVFNDFPIQPGPRRSFSADLAILASGRRPTLAVEFKYEPDHARGDVDIWPTKLNPSVVFWGPDGVLKDIERTRMWVESGLIQSACSVFIDEGGLFRHREPHVGAQWFDIPIGEKQARHVSVLIASATATEEGVAPWLAL
jgi:hypothetical protein